MMESKILVIRQNEKGKSEAGKSVKDFRLTFTFCLFHFNFYEERDA